MNEHIKLPAKLLDYFLRSNKSNINPFQEFSVINPSVLLQDLHFLVQCLISLFVCAFQPEYVITFTPSFISSPQCADLSASTCQPLFMCWHLILCCFSSYRIPHAIIKCRMTILMSYFPYLAARVFPREYCKQTKTNCSIRPLVPLPPDLK